MKKSKDFNFTNRKVMRRSNLFFGKIIKFLFRKLDFDEESLLTLKSFEEKGTLVYASFQSSATSLLIFLNLLNKHDLKKPVVAVGVRQYFFQFISEYFKRMMQFISGIFKKQTGSFSTNKEVFKSIVEARESMLISLLSEQLFIKRFIDIKTDVLQYLIEVQMEQEDPIYVFPQLIFWNRNPERTRSLTTLKATGDKGLFAALFTILKSGTPPFVRVSHPVNLKEEIELAKTDDSKQLARQIRNKLIETYNKEKRTILGPVIKTQQELMEKVLYHQNVLSVIEEEKTSKRSETKLRKKAFKYFNEIAANFSILMIKYFEKSLRYIFRKIFDGIKYNIEDFKKLREASAKGPLILMPAHKSHMDYLIVSSMFYRKKIIPPHILSGSNLTFFPMGTIFRKSGAFFMRRSFKGLALYATVFKQYVKTLISEGYSIEFFIEGGRTRSGKLLSPKVGMMKYLIEAIEEGYNKDLVFVPVTINYNRILEENSYHKELKGKDKKKESTSTFFKSRKLLKRQYGKVYLEFNDPVTLSELKEKFKGLSTDDLAVKIGDYIIGKINDIIVVTPYSIVTTAMLMQNSRGFTKQMVLERVSYLLKYLRTLDSKIADELLHESTLDNIITDITDAFLDDSIISKLSIDDSSVERDEDSKNEELYILEGEERIKISFYANTILQNFLSISFVSVAILKLLSSKTAVTVKKVEGIFIDIKKTLRNEFIYPDYMEDVSGTISNVITYLENENVLKNENGTITISGEKINSLGIFAGMIKSYFESYSLVAEVLMECKKMEIDKKDLIVNIRKKGIRNYHLGGIDYIESLSVSNYQNALNFFKEISAIQMTPKGKMKKNIEVEIVDVKKIADFKDQLQNYLSEIDNSLKLSKGNNIRRVI